METSDWLDFAQGAMANAISFSALGFTLVSGYLVIAYLVGDKLTIRQVSLVNAIFLVANISSTLGVAVSASNGLLGIRQAAAGLNEVTALTQNQAMAVVIVGLVVNIAIVFGCLKFMWDIRHPKS